MSEDPGADRSAAPRASGPTASPGTEGGTEGGTASATDSNAAPDAARGSVADTAADSGSDTASARPALDKKRSIIGGLVGLAVLVLIFVKVIPQIGSYADALTAIKAMSTGDIALIVAAVLLYNAVYGLPFMAATPGLSYPRSFQLNQAAFAIGNGIPAGGAFGLGVQYAMLASYSVPASASTAAIGAVGVWSIFVTLGLPVLGLLAIWGSHTIDVGAYVYIGALGLGVLVTMIVVFGLVMRSEPLAERLGRFGNRLAAPVMRRFRPDDEFDLVPTVLGFRTDIVDLVRRRWGAITIAQVSVSLTQFLIFYFALRGVQGGAGSTSFLVAFGAFAVAQIGIMIPITPGGLGTVDAFMISLLTAMGVGKGDATAATLVWRAASFVPQIVLGVLSLVTWSRTAARAFAVRPGAAASDPAS
jgi:uncharacterized protein (TIRG00374 family)